MKITVNQLRRIIREEAQRAMNEQEGNQEIMSILNSHRDEILNHLKSNPNAIAALLNPQTKNKLSAEISKSQQLQEIDGNMPANLTASGVLGGPMMAMMLPDSVLQQLYSNLGHNGSMAAMVAAGMITGFLADLAIHELGKSKAR